jgi:hypothetical protein
MDEDVKIKYSTRAAKTTTMEYTAVWKEAEVGALDPQDSAKQQAENGATPIASP